MTIGWVESLLLRWGRWSVKATNGYPPYSPMLRDCKSGTDSRYQYDPGIQSLDLYACDRAIRELPEQTRQIIVSVYAMGYSIRSVAVAARCSRTKVNAMLDDTHAQIARYLQKST